MSIRQKLLVSYTLTLILTLIVQLAVVYAIAGVITGDWYIYKNFYKAHFAVAPLSPPAYQVAKTVKQLAIVDPTQLSARDKLAQLDKQVKSAGLGLIVRKETQLLYVSTSYQWADQLATLPTYEEANLNARNTLYVPGRLFSYLKHDFRFTDGKRGSVYLLKEQSPIADVFQKYGPLIIGSLFLLLVLTNILLYGYLSRNIFARLKRLESATKQIQAGELDQPIICQETDEIGHLCRAFEEMRVRLSEMISLRLADEQSRRELISHISHDLKTPLTAIQGYVDGLQEGVANTPEKQAKYLRIIQQKVGRLTELIETLFLLSKLDLPQYPYEFHVMALLPFLQSCVADMQDLLDQHDAQIHWLSDQAVDVNLDAEQFKRVMYNVIENSMRYQHNERDPQLWISYDVQDNYVFVSIADNGQGIATADQTAVFGQFYRAEKSRSDQYGGSGLGLAIAKRIVEGHGGQIKIETNKYQGVTIIFSLPCVERKWHAKNLNHRR